MTNTQITGGKRQAALGFIFITAIMDVLSLGVMIPVLPNLVKAFGGGDTATAADWNVLFATTWGVMQFVCSPILGLMSDRFGRRPVILTSIFGLGVDFLFMAFAPSLWWLFVGRIFNGMTAASFSTAGAYVADVTTPENRAKGFGLMGAAFGIGFTFGPALGGWLWNVDHRAPFLVCAGLALCNWLYGFFVLPESLPPERRQPRFDWKKANPLGSLQLLRRHPGLLGLAGVGFLFQLAHNVLPSVFVLYMGFRYNWGPDTVGLTLMVSGISGVIIQGLVVGPAVRKLGERGALMVGLFSGFAGFTIYALAPTGLLYLCGLPIFAFSGLIQPGLQGLMTRRVAPNEQGQLQGANAALMGIASMIGPSLFLLPFAFAVRHDATLHLPGLPVLIAASLMLLATLLAWAKARPAPALEPHPA
ncbi:TCR/Tet family MFS transporter [uncultured Caulobacter sp.]|uniref:TCR/Tet family MFS transporter n=1 Tax=uncultured Caulobacter sp. TaxID=158749 RepID=UPI00262FF110|nr:TCR/Tet family MFS transporter [uncultured Caulobacter sp.]